MDDKICTFDDQSKEDVLNLLKQETEKELQKQKHGENCFCTWCVPAAQEKLFKLCPELPKKEGKVDPEIFVFAGQTKEEVKDLLKKANGHLEAMGHHPACPVRIQPQKTSAPCESYTSAIFRNQKEAEALYPTREGLGLAFDKESPQEAVPELPDIHSYEEPALEEDMCQFGSVWRKLSGVRPQEKVYEDKTLDNLQDKILNELQKQLPDMTFAWQGDRCYNQYLLINEAKTRFSTDPIIAAFEAVKELVGRDDAEDIIISMIKKKVCNLFI
jgi:hypothetical protein